MKHSITKKLEDAKQNLGFITIYFEKATKMENGYSYKDLEKQHSWWVRWLFVIVLGDLIIFSYLSLVISDISVVWLGFLLVLVAGFILVLGVLGTNRYLEQMKALMRIQENIVKYESAIKIHEKECMELITQAVKECEHLEIENKKKTHKTP